MCDLLTQYTNSNINHLCATNICIYDFQFLNQIGKINNNKNQYIQTRDLNLICLHF